jgi:flavin reductase (DIM6/NTAB) family NADH-FMN oxidoreductase RutF
MSDQILDAKAFRQTLGKFATGVTVVSTTDGDAAHGMTANSFTSVSLDPPLILVSIDNNARIKAKLEESGVLGLSILNAAQKDVSQNFAGQPQESVDDPFEWVDGVPLIRDALARLCCRVTDIVPAGDHSLFIAQVDAFEKSEAEPLMFFSGAYAERAQA